MEHKDAVESQAIERYLLKQMTSDERDAFEEHYFSCASCAEEVRAAARFYDAGQQVASEPVSEPAAPKWQWWKFPSLAPMAASLILFCTVVYQAAFQIPALRQQIEAGQAIAVVSLGEQTRGSEGITVVPAAGPFFLAYFDLPPGAAAAQYRCTIANASGKIVDVITAPAPKRGEPVNLLLNRHRLPDGVYTMTVRPADAASSAPPLAQFRFQL